MELSSHLNSIGMGIFQVGNPPGLKSEANAEVP